MLFGKRFIRLVILAVFLGIGFCSAACPVGDLNGDCQVDLQDLALFAGQWLEMPDCSTLPCADLDGADGVNLADLAILSRNWGLKSYPVLFNEYMSSNHSTIEDPDNPGEYPDWIELYNFGSKAVDVGGCWLSDDPAIAKKFPIPTGFPAKTTVPSGGFLLLWMDRDLKQGPTHFDFKLSATTSEFVGLSDPSGQPIDSLDTIALTADVSYGRKLDGAAEWMIFGPSTQSSPTPGTSNGSVEDDGKVMISEIMYHPYNAAHPLAENILEEYFELYNSGVRPVRLGGWRVTRGVEFTFPEVTIQPKAYLAVAADVATFQGKYPAVSNVVGGWIGHLSNSGETIEVVNTLGRVIDSVPYSDEGDWSSRLLGPVELSHRGWEWSDLTDGQGHSLELRNPAMPNEYGKNWGPSQAVGGTPGQPNSDATDNIAPLILNVKHVPVIPRPADPVTVTARILDEQTGGLTVSLHYRMDTSTYQGTGVYPTYNAASYTVVPMFDDGAHDDDLAGDGIYAGQIPAMPNKTIVEVFVQATDTTGLSRTWPAPSSIDGVAQQVTNLLYQVDATYDPAAVWTAGQDPVYYLIMTEMERGRLAYIGSHSGLSGPNALMNGTFISRDGISTECRYSVGVRNRGHGSRNGPPNNYHVNIPDDHTWNGVSAISFNCRYTQAQIIGRAIYSLAGIVASDTEAAQLRVNGANLAYSGDPMYGVFVRLEAFDSDFATQHFPTDSNGNLYSCFRTDSGQIEAELTYQGSNPDTYRDRYFKDSNASSDDWSDLIHMLDVLNNTPDAVYYQEVSKVINVSQWVHYVALDSLLRNLETGLNMGIGDDYFMYCGITDPRFVLIPHDLDTILGEGNTSGDINQSIFSVILGVSGHNGVEGLKRFFKNPDIAPLFYQAFMDHINGIFNPKTLDPLFDRVIGRFAPGRVASMKQFVRDRTAAVLAQIPQAIKVTTAVNAQTGYIHTTTNTVSLAGLANAIHTRRVTLNGQPAVWTAWTATWTISNVALLPGVNRVVIQAFDAADKETDRSSVDVWYNTGSMVDKSGTLAADQVWSAASGPYHITGLLTIPAGRTLTIQPGTTVFLASGNTVNLEVADGGKILAEGTQYQQIRFASVPASGVSWGGITIHGTAGSPETRMSYVFFEGNGGTCIHSDGGTLFLDNASFGATTHQYVSVDSSSFLISHCVFPKTTAEFEPLHGTGGIKSGGRGILRDCFFGGTSGYNDQFDFTGGNRDRNEQIFEVYNNVFTNASDDMLDLDGTDAWVEGNIFVHCHRNNSPDSSSAVSGGNDSGNTSEITILGNLFYDCDNAATAKQGNFFTMINNTIVRITKTGGLDFDSGVVNVRDTTPDITAFARGFYLEGNVIVDAGQLVRNYDPAQTTVTFNDNILPFEWTGPGGGNVVVDPALKHIPELAETNFTSWEQAQVMRDWFSLQPGSAAQGTGPNGTDMGGVIPFGVSISGVPDGVTSKTDATLIVGVNRTGYGIPTAGFPLGSGFTRYIWRLDTHDWSAELPIAEPIILSGLAEGQHHVEVIGFNDAGRSQNGPILGTNAVVTVSATWTVDTTLYRRLMINEVLARNAGTLPVNGSYPNLVELYYDAPDTELLELGGMKVVDGGSTPNEFVLPFGTKIAGGGYLVLYADRDLTAPGIHLGFFLNGEGDAVKLYNASGELIDSVQFGFQIAGLSIGRLSPDGDWVLCKPTFGFPNVFQPVKGPSGLRINEWFANGKVRFTDDFIELYNPETIPVKMDGLHLTNHSFSEPTLYSMPPLSFVGSQEYIALWDKPGGNANNLNFHLRSESDQIMLLDQNLHLIDGIIYTDQTTDYSQGRTPDGADTLAFFKIPTPGKSNPKGATVVYTTTTLIPENTAKKVLIPTAAVAEAWKGGAAFNDSAWNSGTYISGKAGGVGYENNPGDAVNYTDLISYDIKAMKNVPTGSCYIRVPFTLTADQVASISSLNLKIRRDDGFIAYINGVTAAQSDNVPATPAWNSYTTAGGPGDSTSRQLADYPISNTTVLSSLKIGQNILAVHGMDVANSSDMIISFVLELVTKHIEGENTLAPYEALVDGLRITELMYHPAAGGVEYIELKNVGSQPLNLKGVRIMDGIDYVFGTMSLDPGQYVVVTADIALFQALYGDGIPVVGPYVGALKDRGETIVLVLPDPYVAAILRFTYQGSWYPSTNGGGHSLVIVNDQLPADAWNHAEAWLPSALTGGSPGQ